MPGIDQESDINQVSAIDKVFVVDQMSTVDQLSDVDQVSDASELLASHWSHRHCFHQQQFTVHELDLQQLWLTVTSTDDGMY